MKAAGISRFVMMAAVAALVAGGVTPALAQITFNNFSNPTGLTLNGNAAAPVTNGNMQVLRLTPDAPSRAGSAWFNTQQQPVQGGFSTTFQFQFTQTGDAHTPADGIAFVIQNSNLTALGQGGGSIGYADGGGSCPGPGGEGTVPCDGGGGIPNSLAIEFDTFDNGFGTGDTNANHIAVQSCGVVGGVPQPNSPAHTTNNAFNFPNCLIGSVASPSTSMSDGNPHTVTISYAPPSCTGCLGALTVILDNNNVLTTAVTLENELNLSTGGKAWVGFTSATGAAFENHDILSWTFTPQTQSVALPAPGVKGSANFSGGINQGGFDQTATIDPASPVTSATLKIKAIPTDRNVCNKLVQQTFPSAQCFVFQNADGKGAHKAVLFELTCSNKDGDCGQNIIADLGNDFVFQNSDNPFFKLLSSTIGGYVGVLKGDSLSPNGACQIDSTHPLNFPSNQISGFTLSGDPLGGTTQKAHPGTSCWTIVYGVSGERPPGITIASPTATTYLQGAQGATLPASYTCQTPVTSQDPLGTNSPVGPYLTVGSCTQSQAPNNLTNNLCGPTGPTSFASGVTCGGLFDISTVGLHVFVVTAKDTAGNVNAKAVVYKVVKPPKP